MTLEEKMQEIVRDVCIPTITLNHLTMQYRALIHAEDQKHFYGLDADPVKAFDQAQEQLDAYRASPAYSRGGR